MFVKLCFSLWIISLVPDPHHYIREAAKKFFFAVAREGLDIVTAKNLSEADRELWLSFDEMALRETYVYDTKTKKVLQPAKKLQCVMVRSLISGWKLPVYFSTDENMTIDILSEITQALEYRGFTVRGASFDLGNKTFMSQCKFDKGKHFIPHPVDPRRRFYLLPDPPHLIKLLRNHVFSKVGNLMLLISQKIHLLFQKYYTKKSFREADKKKLCFP